MQRINRRHRDQKHHKIRDDVHDRREKVDCERVDTDGPHGGYEDRGWHAGETNEDFLDGAPEEEEADEVAADEAGAAFLEDSAVLEQEGEFGDDLGSVVDGHGGEEAL